VKCGIRDAECGIEREKDRYTGLMRLKVFHTHLVCFFLISMLTSWYKEEE